MSVGKIYPEIDAKLGRWIGSQLMFFVATAPELGGHVNVSPKGPIESLCVVDAHTSPTSIRSEAAPRRWLTCARTAGSA